ncbi:ArnT family glycosyltransferase [Galbibacter pacificus]|uniref:Glycosyltransferase family 39 protein n=1 Tax=Galbibacter pacificus TaxID=2996052 RepID=A0ABT6FUS6_9FLAO|nr:glycosyltransferase family 39 protein [Galbibacter pacificus]MDG3583513.1 glycosyltransferase family 39 protein [Galbibacter pacificus]MDG3587011.1 glycosyltransferase family 39 protein [Galbibacter pacificus]
MNIKGLPPYRSFKGYSYVFVLLLIAVLLIRFPFFFRDYIDRDESTFILMGQSIVDGYLPYIKLWDLKPPLLFYFFAGIIFLFGKSFLAIRFIGCVLISISAFVVYKMLKEISSKKIALLGGVLFIITASLFGNIQGVMSEHISIFFFIPALFILWKNHTNYVSLFFVGLLLGCSMMTKLNMAYPALLLGIFLCINKLYHENIVKAFLSGFFLLFGTLLTITITAIPYLLTSNFNVWWNSVILAPIAYNPASSLITKLVLSFFVVCAIGVAYILYKKYNHHIKKIQRLYVLIVLSLIGVLISFIDAGKVNGHYLIQVFPFLIVCLMIWLYNTRFKNYISLKLITILLIITPMESYVEYGTLANRLVQGKTLYNEEGFEIPEYFTKTHVNPNNILFVDYHIGYWLMNENIPSKAMTHPSNLYREALFPYMGIHSSSSEEEIFRIFNIVKPEYIVGPDPDYLFSKKEKDYPLESSIFDRLLISKYRLQKTIGNAGIYKRKI